MSNRALTFASSDTQHEATSLVLAQNGHSRYRIVIAKEAPVATRTAAQELASAIKITSGATIPIGDDTQPVTPFEILIGTSSRVLSLCPQLQSSNFGPEEWRIQTFPPRLVILGGEPRGTLYGVCDFLSRFCGCRWYAPDASYYPKHRRLILPCLDISGAPAFEYRNFILSDINDPAWAARNFLNGFNSPATELWGGRVTHWQYGHSYHALLPEGKYFRKHPEYFDSVSRTKKDLDDPPNPCGTNRKVAEIVAQNLRRVIETEIEKNPANATKLFYLAQNDGGSPCTCRYCSRLIRQEGTSGAPLFLLANKVAESLQDHFPDVRFITLAYYFSLRPPRYMRMHPNVIVQACSIETCHSHPLAKCDKHSSRIFRQCLEGWRLAAEHLWVWDYMPRLWHPFLPSPGVCAYDRNFKWLKEMGVEGIFYQTGYDHDFNMLHAWLLCQLLHNPYQDSRSLRNEFVSFYYGQAAPFIIQYLDRMERSFAGGRHHLTYKEDAVKPFFSSDLAHFARSVFSKALESVKGEKDIFRRVENEAMRVLCADMHRRIRQNITRGSVKNGRLFVRRSVSLKNDVATFLSWRKKNLASDAARKCTTFVESDTVTLSNGKTELEFIPRLDGRLIGIRFHKAKLPLLAPAQNKQGAFDIESGYRELWLAAPTKQPDQTISSWSFADTGEGVHEWGGFSLAQNLPQDVRGTRLNYQIGGRFAEPMQWERWIRLSESRPAFHIESWIVNRAQGLRDGAVRTRLPLHVGQKKATRLFLPRDTIKKGQAWILAPKNGAIQCAVLSPERWLLRYEAVSNLPFHLRVEWISEENILISLETSRQKLHAGAGYKFGQLIELQYK